MLCGFLTALLLLNHILSTTVFWLLSLWSESLKHCLPYCPYQISFRLGQSLPRCLYGVICLQQPWHFLFQRSWKYRHSCMRQLLPYFCYWVIDDMQFLPYSPYWITVCLWKILTYCSYLIRTQVFPTVATERRCEHQRFLLWRNRRQIRRDSL